MKDGGENEYILKSSSAYVSCAVDGKTYTYHFTGVTSIEHNLALNLNNASAQGTDIVNGARNLPNQVTLSVVETDVEHSPGWAAGMMNVLASLKRRRILCEVVTPLVTYERMLLTEITATQDEENQDGWSGTLVFMEYISVTEENEANTKANDNSSVRKNTGSSGTTKVTGSVLLSLLKNK